VLMTAIASRTTTCTSMLINQAGIDLNKPLDGLATTAGASSVAGSGWGAGGGAAGRRPASARPLASGCGDRGRGCPRPAAAGGCFADGSE